MDGAASYIIAIVVLVFLSAFFSATETAFTSLSRIRIKNMANEGHKRASLVLKLSENFDYLLTTVLIGNNIVNIAMTAIATVLFVRLYGEYGPTVSTVVMTVIVLIFGEISPKSIAKEVPEKYALIVAPVIMAVSFVLRPLNFIFIQWKRFITKAFNITSSRRITDNELITIVEEAETDGTFDEERSELIQNAIEFDDITAEEILTPRVDLIAIEINADKAEIARIFLETGFSRLPVYEDNLDNIMGVLNQKDFHNYIANSEKGIEDFVNPVLFVAGSVKIDVLLRRLQQGKVHMAVIVDEYGGTEGIVTIEDIVEELVGEIFDEHDKSSVQSILPMQDGSFMIRADESLENMFDFFELEGEEEHFDATTVNGWLMIMLDRMPEVGDEFTYLDLHVRITKADDRKAVQINIKKISEEENE